MTSATASNKKSGDTATNDDSKNDPLLVPTLLRLTEGLPRRELKQMISEARLCEEALQKEIKDLRAGISQTSAKTNPADIMLETEVTPPDRFFTVSSLMGRLREDLATPLPPNSTLPALRAQNGSVLQSQQPLPKKRKLDAAASSLSSYLQVQRQLLALPQNPEYTRICLLYTSPSPRD